LKLKIIGAVIEEQKVTFAVVLVKEAAMHTNYDAEKTRASLQVLFPGLPLVLASNEQGEYEYYGRPDLAKFLASIDASRIPWKEYTLS
jgi:hypothetical protein